MRPLGRRLALDTAYLLTGLPAGILTFTVVVTGWSLAAGLLITLVGLPVAYATVLLGRALGRMERVRAALVLGEPVRERYRPLEGGFFARLKAMALDAQTWKDLLWHLLLLGVGIAGFTIATTAWGTALGLLTMPAWWWAVPASDPVDLGLFHVDGWGWALVASAAGLVALPLAAALVRGTAAGTAALARLLLGPGRAELEQRVEHLATTRAGAVDAASAELERLERDLHDGAQARLVAVAMELGMAEEQLDAGAGGVPEARERVTAAREETRRALGELRDLARGMRPGLLAERGLGEAVRSLAARSPVPATVRVDAGEPRPPATVESAAYFVVAEALANAAKHAGATRVTVDVARTADRLEVLVADDGRGGAVAAGRGLEGLRKRVAALDGTLTITSPAGAGTHVRAELPCAS